MGEPAPRKTHRLKAATLLESVLAMSLMAGALSFAVGLYSRILASDHAADRMRAWALTEVVLAGRLQNGGIDVPRSTRFEIKVSGTPIAPGVTELTITCTRGGRALLERKCIIPSRP